MSKPTQGLFTLRATDNNSHSSLYNSQTTKWPCYSWKTILLSDGKNITCHRNIAKCNTESVIIFLLLIKISDIQTNQPVISVQINSTFFASNKGAPRE